MGGDFDHRWTQTRESIEVMKALWTQDEAEYHGTYYDFPSLKVFPKPAQNPHPPVFLGGNARNVFRRIVAYGDGWFPVRVSPEEVQAARATLDELAESAGRDPKSIQICVYGVSDRDTINRMEEAGADMAVVGIGRCRRRRGQRRPGKHGGGRAGVGVFAGGPLQRTEVTYADRRSHSHLAGPHCAGGAGEHDQHLRVPGRRDQHRGRDQGAHAGVGGGQGRGSGCRRAAGAPAGSKRLADQHPGRHAGALRGDASGPGGQGRRGAPDAGGRHQGFQAAPDGQQLLSRRPAHVPLLRGDGRRHGRRDPLRAVGPHAAGRHGLGGAGAGS